MVRYLDASGNDLVPREDRVWTVNGTALRMVAALNAAEVAVPTYLLLIAEESAVTGLKTATLAMHCFWEGEAKLGSIAGVRATQSAFFDGNEVVRLQYDPQVVDYEALVREAAQLACAQQVYPDSAEQSVALERMEGVRIGRLTDVPSVRPAPTVRSNNTISIIRRGGILR